MTTDQVLGIIIIVTAVIVCVPVLHQIRSGEERLRDMWGFLLFAAGLLAVGAAYAVPELPAKTYAVWVGLGAAVGGLLSRPT